MTLLAERTAQTDQLIVESAEKLLFPSAGSGLALLAVGGYGRRQLFPYSDIDLLLLFENERLMGACKDAISTFLRQLWDAGLRMSHSVRTPAECTEVRVTLTDAERMAYAVTEAEERYRAAATARTKLPVVRALVDKHRGEQILVIGAYIDQLHELGEYLNAPVLQGSTTNKERERLFDEFRSGSLRTLVISKVGNFSIDLPEAAVAIQVSGTFGSRQEEAQRLGRVLRPKADGRQAHFYTVVSRDTIDTEYAAHRQRFLAEQGYAYTIVDADDVLDPPLPQID